MQPVDYDDLVTYDGRVNRNAIVRCRFCYSLVNYADKPKHTIWHRSRDRFNAEVMLAIATGEIPTNWKERALLQCDSESAQQFSPPF